MSVCSMNRRDERQQARRGEAEEERERAREKWENCMAAGEMQRRRMLLVDGEKHKRS